MTYSSITLCVVLGTIVYTSKQTQSHIFTLFTRLVRFFVALLCLNSYLPQYLLAWFATCPRSPPSLSPFFLPFCLLHACVHHLHISLPYSSSSRATDRATSTGTSSRPFEKLFLSFSCLSCSICSYGPTRICGSQGRSKSRCSPLTKYVS